MTSEKHRPTVAILASGSGTTAEVCAQAIYDGVVDMDIGLVIASRFDAGILERVERWNREFGFDVEAAVINGDTHDKGPAKRGQTDEEAEAITSWVKQRGIGNIILLGYMRQVRGVLIEEYGYLPDEHSSPYEAGMLNTHPGLLPQTADTYGEDAAQRILDLGLEASAHTVHVVSAEIDKGPILAVHPVPVMPGDNKESLNARIQKEEKDHIAQDIDKFLKNQAAHYAALTPDR